MTEEGIIITSPLLKKRFDKIVENSKNSGIEKPNHVSWEEVTFVRMIVIAENYFIKENDLIHEDRGT
jgi:hypothetical protein